MLVDRAHAFLVSAESLVTPHSADPSGLLVRDLVGRVRRDGERLAGGLPLGDFVV